MLVAYMWYTNIILYFVSKFYRTLDDTKKIRFAIHKTNNLKEQLYQKERTFHMSVSFLKFLLTAQFS